MFLLAGDVPSHLRVNHSLNVADPSDESPDFQQRTRKISNQYLSGRPIFLLSASLKGPFDAQWHNPWLEDNQRSKRRRLEKQPLGQDTLQPSTTPSIEIPESLPCHQNQSPHKAYTTVSIGTGTTGDAAANRNREYTCGADPERKRSSRTESLDQTRVPTVQRKGSKPAKSHRLRNRYDNADTNQRLPVPVPVPGDNEKRTESSVQCSYPFHEEERPPSLPTPNDSRPRSREKTSSEFDQSYPILKTPASPENKSSGSEIFAEQNALTTPVSLRSSYETKPLDHEQPRIQEEKSRETGLKLSARRRKRTLNTEQYCLECGTQDSYQWRKGPQGPRTLCCSCGSKWTHKQQQLRKQNTDTKDADEVKRHDKNDRLRPRQAAHKNTRINPSRKVIKNSSITPRGASNKGGLARNAGARRKHSEICKRCFPNIAVRKAIMANDATTLEEILYPETLLLRGHASPTTRVWDNGDGHCGPASLVKGKLMKPRAPVSPEKRYKKHRMAEVDEEYESEKQCRKIKKRKVTTFDTPQQPNRRNEVPVALIHNNAGDGHLRTPAQHDEFDKLDNDVDTNTIKDMHRTIYEPKRQPGQQQVRRGPSTEKDVQSEIQTEKKSSKAPESSVRQYRRGSVPSPCPKPSTQAALVEAQEALFDHLISPSLNKSPSRNADVRHAPGPRSKFRSTHLPDYTDWASNEKPSNTQDLFDETLDFGSSGILKAQTPAQKTVGTGEAEKPQENEPDQTLDLPTSPPTSQPEFDFPDNDTGSDQQSSPSVTARAQSETNEHTSAQTPPRSPLFSSSTKFIVRSPNERYAQQSPTLLNMFESVDVDEAVEAADSVLETWKT